jgi:molybdenum cofactor sulfurtransferase
MLPHTFIEFAATKKSISLRTGCMCNSGGAAAMLGVEHEMKRLVPGLTLKAFEEIVGMEVGVVRISLGLASSFQDVWKILQFAAMIGHEKSRQALWDLWIEMPHTGHSRHELP